MATVGTYYYDGITFAASTDIFTDAALSIPAPDGWYAFGGVYREKVGGILGPPQTCPTCVIPCGTPIVGTGGAGKYTLQLDLGNTPGAAIITFNVGISTTTSFPIPDGCTWTYDGVTASEYSTLVGGYIEGIIGAQSGNPGDLSCGGMTTANGIPATTGQSYVYDPLTQSFIPGATIPLGPYDGITAGTGESTLLDWNCQNLLVADCGCGSPGTCQGVAMPLISGNPIAPNLPAGPNWPVYGNESRNAVMVVPSPPGTTNNILTVEVEGPCAGTWWGIDIQCPEELPALQSSAIVTSGTVCSAPITTTVYHVPIDKWGNTNPCSSYYIGGSLFPAAGALGQADGVLGLHDWIFADPYGVTPLPAGNYKIESPAGSGTYYDVEVGVREYRDVDANGHALKPELYTGATQSSGPIRDGIVKSMIPC